MEKEINKEEFDGDGLDNRIVLTGEDGSEICFEFLDLIEYEGGEYVVLLPELAEGEEDDGEVVILKVEAYDDDTESYVAVEDDVLNAVFEIFKAKFIDEFNFLG